ncbi:GH3 auxin-responsive promoter family protein [Psychroflexus maritimus]|uniref:GH3 auxin-responsive promoter family protein n=1 Tax=Psychroflexus maritimus TaxID=2714865 RepID=A0A967AHH2_9FLAO|nr:GH3 auxin-responsive promoter family protein [Psychroflexus maritimus]NGZ90571.1 GH3 auxin-responsive promoter family protein [Psychroflexus maritimus]
MSLKSFAAKIFAKLVQAQTKAWANKPVQTQQKVFQMLLHKAKNTAYGRAHNFAAIKTPEDFRNKVKISDYEAVRPYVERILKGESDVLWPGKPLYFAKTSGTTSGAKYIPLTKESMPYHISAARNAILNYIAESGNAKFIDGKMIFLQGSPELSEKNGILFGRLSGISAHFVPNYLQKNRMPSWETNCIEDWETKINAIVEETMNKNMSVISGIPSWVQTYFEKLHQKTGKTIKEIFPNFDLFIYGGVNYEPYRTKFEELIGQQLPSIELYPASEGFFAYQDQQDAEGMLLLLNAGIYYEFIEAEKFYEENPKVYEIGEVKKDVNYVMIISTNAGLWRYNVGDTVMFTSTSPYRVKVSGRIKHFTSAFGEHVIAKEVEEAIQKASAKTKALISEFTVAPQVKPKEGLPYHEWFIEFEKEPKNMEDFTNLLEESVRSQNSYYDDLIVGKILRKLVVTKVKKDGFNNYMKSIGKLGGQNKVPRLSNDRKIAEQLEQFTV